MIRSEDDFYRLWKIGFSLSLIAFTFLLMVYFALSSGLLPRSLL